jgi:uncharacterized membrane protein YhaH (DUF805 family)
MMNPLIDKRHLKEYILFGLIAAVLYCVMLFFHLRSGDYKSSYLLYIGNVLFGAAIFIYNMQLIKRPYDEQRATSMLIAAHVTAAIGTAFSVIFCIVMMTIFHPEIFSAGPSDTGLANAPANTQLKAPSGWLMMVCINALLINFSVGSFLSIMVSYAGKRNQTKDKPTDLSKHVPDKK